MFQQTLIASASSYIQLALFPMCLQVAGYSGGVIPIDSIVTVVTKVKTLTGSFRHLTVDHADFWGFDH